MPEILTNEHPEAAKTGVESPHRIARSEETALIEQTIRWQINLVMNVNDLTLREISRGKIEPVTGIFVHKADQQVNVTAGIEEVLKDRIDGLRPAGESWYEVLKPVAGQREFRENQ